MDTDRTSDLRSSVFICGYDVAVPATTEYNPLCFGCGYALRGLTSDRCPECGRGFDPADPRTMNLGRPLGFAARMMLKPIGWPTVVLALGACGAMAWVTRWPGRLADFSLIDE